MSKPSNFLASKLTVNSELHTKVLARLLTRLDMSKKAFAGFHKKCDEREDDFVAYLPETETDARRKAKRAGGDPEYTTINVPYGYAQLLSAHTYYTSVFCARTPIFQFQGRHGEGEMQTQAMESIIDYQQQVGRNNLPLYLWLMDPGKYGIGIIGYYWDTQVVYAAQQVERPKTFLGIPTGGTEKKIERIEQVAYEGYKLYNVRPQDFLPDPRVPLSRFQEGEFVGRYVYIAGNTLWNRELDGEYFNCKEARAMAYTAAQGSLQGSSGNWIDLPSAPNLQDVDSNIEIAGVEGHEITVELIPSDWGLGKEKRPEKWVFTVAMDRIIIQARPLGYLHNQYPFEVMEYEPEGYGMHKRSMLEVVQPMSDTLTWLFNTHFYNVRKVLNDEIVVDPSRVNMRDVEAPGPGRVIRLKPQAYGTDTRMALSKLPTSTVTNQHMQDAQSVMRTMQQMVGVNDNLMGSLNPGGRKTATEVRSSGEYGISRLKTNCEYFSAMGFTPLAQQLVQTTQQLYSGEKRYRIARDLMKDAEQYMPISAADIAGYYDFINVDGTMPLDRIAQVAMWQQLMQGIQQDPRAMMTYDTGKIFGWIAQLAGLRNINQFKINIVSDEQAALDAQAGNTIPMPTGGGGPQGENIANQMGLGNG